MPAAGLIDAQVEEMSGRGLQSRQPMRCWKIMLQSLSRSGWNFTTAADKLVQRCRSMLRLSKVPPGWKAAATINTILIQLSLVIMSILLGIAHAHSGGSGYTAFYEADCESGHASRANLLVHLLINIFSTAVLASSSFFMQLLNAPSKAELGLAHQNRSWLDIGVFSLRNAVRLSRFKTTCWLLFFASSIGIHLFSNGSVFEIDVRATDFQLVIAAEPFVTGGLAVYPGASGAFNQPAYRRNLTRWNETGEMDLRIANVAKQAGSWTKLDIGECKSRYLQCAGIRFQRDLILVVDQPGGWIPDQVWPNTSDYAAVLWENILYNMKDTRNETNYLWYYTPCSMHAGQKFDPSAERYAPTTCENTCALQMGQEYTTSESDWVYPFFGRQEPRKSDSYYTEYSGVDPPLQSGIGFNNSYNSLTVKYCLAEQMNPTCTVAVSTTLLLVVFICLLLKAVLCIVVMSTIRRNTSVVTLGDAIEYFIVNPPWATAGSCLADQKAWRSRESHFSIMSSPRQWDDTPRLAMDAVPKTVWYCTYTLFFIGIGLSAYSFIAAYLSGFQFTSAYGPSPHSPFIGAFGDTSFITLVLLANTPQLILSICYLSFNDILTRLQMAKEWAMMSVVFQPLRVTKPKGEQISTYRLQLPYVYSIPLLALSVLMHWVMSNCLFVYISEGGYYSEIRNLRSDPSIQDRPFDAFAALGYSTKALLAFLILSTFIFTVPIFLGMRRLPGRCMIVGSNSLAISAACHVPPTSATIIDARSACPEYTDGTVSPETERTEVHEEGVDGISVESDTLISPASTTTLTESSSMDSLHDVDNIDAAVSVVDIRISSESPDTRIGFGDVHRDPETLPSVVDLWDNCRWRRKTLVNISQGKLKWGVVPIPDEWQDEYPDYDDPVEHICFGTEWDNVRPPVDEHWYA